MIEGREGCGGERAPSSSNSSRARIRHSRPSQQPQPELSLDTPKHLSTWRPLLLQRLREELDRARPRQNLPDPPLQPERDPGA